MPAKQEELYLKTRQAWRQWLEKNHKTNQGIWLIYYKKHTGKPRIPYDDAVEEALCFGWIDSIIKRIDDDKYMQKFTQRNSRSKWSDLNKKRVTKMIKQGLMTEAGLAKITEAKKAGIWDSTESSKTNLEMPDDFQQALAKNKKANDYFNQLAPSYSKLYIRWIFAAKKQETRTKRIKEAVTMLSQNKKLGMK